MTAPNHIAGGIVFTGFFTSLYNINILESWQTIAVAFAAMLLPDIDHTKSLIGKIFYPISRLISRNFGHRTITHSLLFLIAVTCVGYIMDILYSTNLAYILFFGVLSHFILDMITLQGIPLFYPFKKNPCVLPANPDMRIRTGNVRQEGIAFFVFAILALFLQDLFTQGFWTTYNQQFTSIEHIYREYNNHNNIIEVDYDYHFIDQHHSGKAMLLYATSNELHLLDHGEFFKLNKTVSGIRINNLNFTIMENEKITRKIQFMGSLEELNKFLKKKYIMNLNLNFSEKVNLKNKSNADKHEISNVYQPYFEFDNSARIEKLRQKVSSETQKVAMLNSEIDEKISKLKKLKESLKDKIKSDYQLDKTTKEIIRLKKEIKSNKVDLAGVQNATLEYTSAKNKSVKVDGKIWYFNDIDVN